MQALQVMQKCVVAVSPELSLRSFEELLMAEDISGAPVTGCSTIAPVKTPVFCFTSAIRARSLRRAAAST